MHLHGVLDIEALQRALEAVMERHEVLRTNYAADEGNPIQLVSPDVTFPLPQIDLHNIEKLSGIPRRFWICRGEAAKPFDLAHDRLIRGMLLPSGILRADTGSAVMHHIVSDRWSKEILARDLTELYDAFRERRPSLLPPLPIQYADYAVWQRNLAQW